MPTRRPTISESARLVSWAMRCAAASVSFMTCGRGRGFALETGVGEVGVMSVMWSIPRPIQCRRCSCERSCPNASPHIENEARLVRHPVRRPRRIPYQIDVHDADTGNAGDRVLHHLRQFAGRRTVRRGQRHHHIDRAVVLEGDLVDQAELVDVGRNFRVEHGFQRRHDFAAQPLGFLRRQRRMGFHIAGFDLKLLYFRILGFRILGFNSVVHENNSRALISAWARWSTSSRVLYIPNEARQVAVTLNRSKSGITQWVPARTAIPCRSITVATSWGWAPFISNEITGPLALAVPIRRSELISRRRSWA